MGTDLNLICKCPSCKTDIDFAFLGRAYYFTDSEDIPSLNCVLNEIDRVRKELIVTKVCDDIDRFDSLLDDLVKLGRQELMAIMLTNFNVEIHKS